MKIKNIKSEIFSLVVTFATIFFLAGGAAMAQSEQPEQTNKDAESPQANACSSARTFTYASGAQKFAFCITDHGNIRNLEFPATFKQINNREGYVLCNGTVTNGFDAAIAEDGFGLPTIKQPGGPHKLPLTITRQTTDGKFKLTQTFDWNGPEKEVLITMAVKNISASSINSIALARYFDGDMNNQGDDDYYDSGPDSVWGREATEKKSVRYGLALTAQSFNFAHEAYTEFYSDWSPYGSTHDATTCYPNAAVPGLTLLGDYVGRLTYKLGTIGPGATKTVKIIYRRF
jgi:hypothetical protein